MSNKGSNKGSNKVLGLVSLVILILIPLQALAVSARKMVSRGNAAYAAEKYDEALEAYDSASVEAPESARIYFNKGTAYYRQGDYNSAVDAFEEAAVKSRDGGLEARAKFNLGNCAFMAAERQKDNDLKKSLEAYNKSISHFLEALERDPGLTEAAENIEVVRLVMKTILDEIKKQEEAEQKEKAAAEETAEKIKQLIEKQQGLLDRSLELSAKVGEEADHRSPGGDPDDQAKISEDQKTVRDETQDFLESMLKVKQNPLDPASPPEAHMENAVADQDKAIEAFENDRAESAQPNQRHAVDELEKALASLGEKENQKEQGGKQGEGQPESAEPSTRDQEQNQKGREQQQAAAVQLPDDAQNILDEEKENQKRRKLQAAGGYREVEKDW